MSLKSNWIKLLLIVGVFAGVYFLPASVLDFDNPIGEALYLARWYARAHVLLCLVPAFFIAGGIAVFVRQASVIRYLGAKANKVVAYGVASVSGSVLAVCSCTVLPLFAGIYRMGAGIGPATAPTATAPSGVTMSQQAVMATSPPRSQAMAELLMTLIIGSILTTPVLLGMIYYRLGKKG